MICSPPPSPPSLHSPQSHNTSKRNAISLSRTTTCETSLSLSLRSMKEASSIASDLKALVSVSKMRRTKLFAYGFVLAFVAYTGFLAFNPSNNSSSPWFSNLFSSSSATSFKASIAPYRSQVSSFFSHLFPNSTEASLGDLAGGSSEAPILGAFKENGTRVGVDSPKNGVLGKNQTERSVGIKKDTAGGVTEEKQVKDGVEGKKDPSLEAKNQTGTGVSEEKQVKNGAGSDKIGAASEKDGILGVKNQTKSKVSDEKQVNSAADSDKNGVGVKKDASLGATNPTGSGVSEAKQVKNGSASDKNGVVAKKDENLEARNPTSAIGVSGDRETTSKANSTQTATKVIGEGAKVSNSTSSLAKRNSSTEAISNGGGRKKEKWIEDMIGCDIFHGHWVKDDSYPLYPEGSCPHIDEPFNCYLNGRPDRSYQRFRWQPSGCNIPRLNATDMLERLRGKRLVFVGDSLNRNMWESLVCILRNSLKDKKKVFEASGKHEFRTEGSYSFLFKDYKATVEFFRSPFLVQEWEMPAGNGTKETLRLDIIERSSSKYKDAHVIIFNTGHWWTHEKTSKGKDYYQEGNRVYSELNVVEAFHKALNTWAKWVDTNVNPKKTLVFFRGYSASHFSGGQWNSGGACDRETEPIKNEKYLSSYPPKMRVLESVIKGMKTPVNYLNITRITDFRKDAHPSVYRKQNLTEEEKRDPLRFQDCSHWCLPGVPDTWNELVYAQLIIKQYQMGL